MKHLDTLLFKEQSPEALAPQLVCLYVCLLVTHLLALEWSLAALAP